MFLSLVFHNHQPVGQLPWAFNDVWREAYEPFLKVLDEHPSVRVGLHYTGSLLDWLLQHRPDTIAQVRRMAARGQVEILAGGYYEPILAVWPREDQVAQVSRLRDKVEQVFGVAPRGLWLAERVWEPALAEVISSCGIDYTFVDSSVFGAAGVAASQTFGFYQTSNTPLRVFPINEPLRHHMPWREPEWVIEYLKTTAQESKDDALALFADDGEKFGAWPGTFDLVYTRGWLDCLCIALEENAEWLSTVTPGEYLQTHQPLGSVDLPAGSYGEMQDWSGGNWRNFLNRYTESRDIYQEVLRSSEKVRSASNHPQHAPALNHVLRAQANDAYWHGVFGGLYLRHLRQALYAEATQAAILINGTEPFINVEEAPEGEALLNSESHRVGLRAHGGHGYLWISKPARHNILSTLRRYREPYHSQGAPVDWYPRGILLDHFFGEGVTPEQFATASFPEQGDFCSEPWQLQTETAADFVTATLQRHGHVWTQDPNGQALHAPLSITKRLTLRAASPRIEVEYSFRNAGAQSLDVWWGSEWNIAMTGVDLPDRHYHGDDHQKRHRFDEIAQFEAVTNPIAADRWLQLWVEWQFPQPLAMWHVPINTVSQKEGGDIETTPQSSAFVFHRRLQLQPQEEYSLSFTVEVTAKRPL
ncbi:MAG TPA: alpha-amylase/4-alpha-glucanotransferase domain-containing protein [Abditibacteriaceae bacterium]|jgi:alpha-amylase